MKKYVAKLCDTAILEFNEKEFKNTEDKHDDDLYFNLCELIDTDWAYFGADEEDNQ